MYYGFNAIELWDVSSIPVPLTTLVSPKLASGRFDGHCYTMTWSTCNTFLLGVFGSKQANRSRVANSDLTDPVATVGTHFYKPYHLVVWNVHTRTITSMFR